MLDNEPSENERSKGPEFSLTQTVEEMRQHGFAQMENAREKQKSLSSLQANPSEIEKKGEVVVQDLRSKIREILVKEAGIEQLEQQKKVLKDRRTSIAKENADLERRIREDEKKAWKVLAQFSTYRKKMNDHRAAASQVEAQKVLEEKKAVIRKLKEKREELREDLENLTGSTVEEAKSEMEALKVEISVMKKTAAERRENLLKETETHVQIRKDIEVCFQIQNRRFEAVVRRLQLQLSRAQTAHRQVCEDVRCLERELAELMQRLRSCLGSVFRETLASVELLLAQLPHPDSRGQQS